MATDYTQLVTSNFRSQPKLMAWAAAITQPLGQVSDLNASMPAAFGIDTAVGAQLDAIGLWVGVSRHQVVPVANAFFSWNTPGQGWNQANWKGPYAPASGLVDLDDDTYRVVLKAKIGSNYWDGSLQAVNAIGQSAFSSIGVSCFVLDNLDMTVTIYILGAPTVAVLAMIERGLAPPVSAGIGIVGYVLASTAGAPFFALDVTTTSLSGGLDFGAL